MYLNVTINNTLLWYYQLNKGEKRSSFQVENEEDNKLKAICISNTIEHVCGGNKNDLTNYCEIVFKLLFHINLLPYRNLSHIQI